MGVDEALLASARRGTASVRFYTWQGPWLSLGYAQRIGTERLRALRAGGVGWVRRFTGGRGVLHGADLTYSIAAPEGQLPPTVRASYRLVADALLVAMASLGVSATRNAPAPGVAAATGFDCFDSAAPDEICIAGRKLSGSAQRRVAGAVLQHGSIRLAADPPTAASAVATGSARGPGLGGTSLAEEGFDISPEALEQACVSALQTALGVRLQPSELTAEERSHARARTAEPLASLRRVPGLAP